MISYRFRRRAFMTALSGGVGLKIMLRNLEGAAQGMRSPARVLVTHWPVGIVAGSNNALWKPGVNGGSVGGSVGLKPFADAGLGPDMTVMKGLSTPIGAGGGHEGGTVALVTGVAPPGTRIGEQEGDDAYAGGPSFEQLLLANVPGLQRPAPSPGYANSIADSRTDWGEISTKCLSYSTEMQAIATIDASTRQEAKPLMPEISPLKQYTSLFSTFVPGTGTGGQGGGAPPADALLKQLVARQSVLDFAIEELNQVKRLAPSDARNKLNIHTDAVVAAEQQVVRSINGYGNATGAGGAGGTGSGGAGGSGASTCGTCSKILEPPSMSVTGKADGTKGVGGSFADVRAMQDDAPLHAQAGAAHLAVLKAAFVCDIIRVGTYQWSPGTNHVGFALYPGSTDPYQHHPTSHKIGTADTVSATTVAALSAYAQFLYNVQLWYFARHAENLATWKTAVDGCGNSLLDFTCVPFLTEVRACGHERTQMPAMLIGGKGLGLQHDRYLTDAITINQLWGTIARAVGWSSPPAPFGAPVAGFLPG